MDPHVSLFQSHTRHLASLTSLDNLDGVAHRIRKEVQEHAKALIETIQINHQAQAQSDQQSAAIIHHSQELLTMLLRVIRHCIDCKGASAEADVSQNKIAAIDRGVSLAAGLRSILELRGTKTRQHAERTLMKGVRSERRKYTKAVFAYIQGTNAFDELLEELSSPFIALLRDRLAVDLKSKDAVVGETEMCATLAETKERIRVDFARVTREWGVSCEGAVRFFEEHAGAAFEEAHAQLRQRQPQAENRSPSRIFRRQPDGKVLLLNRANSSPVSSSPTHTHMQTQSLSTGRNHTLREALCR